MARGYALVVERDRRDGIRYGILGPFDVQSDGQPVPLGGLRQRSVLALLLLNAGHVVAVDRLVDEVWEGCPPRAVERSVQVYVSRLRKVLTPARGAAPLVTRASGYMLDVDPQQIDAARFERLAAEGRRAHSDGDEESAGKLLRSALELWRGSALADFPQRWAHAHAARLDELRQIAVETRIEVDLALGRHAELISELTLAVTEQPLRERVHEQRMLALYRCGRQADALQAYQEAYRLLTEEHGIDPGSRLRDLEAAILRQDPRLDWVPPQRPALAVVGAPLPVPAQLPAGIADFTGRAAELGRLAAMAGGDAAAMAITVVAGAAGVGKTALTVHWAHRVAPTLPDGQLYIDLRGSEPGQRVRPVEALAQFLRALGVDAKKVPPSEQEAAGLYRSLLATRRVLVVLDNAGSAEQVRPLLPGGTNCAVLATSRDRLTGLVARDGARRLTLDVLPRAEAVALLERILGAQRVRAEPGAIAELADGCGYLPLALRITAAHLVNHAHRSIADYVDEFRAGDRLTALRINGEEASGVRAAFDQSYATLSAEVRRAFRLLGLVPGVDFTADALAAIAGTTPARARELLERLADAHLVDQHRSDRYAFHDLLRRFARDRTGAEDDEAGRGAATLRLYDWYLRNVDAAARLLYPQMLRLPPIRQQPEDLPDEAFADRAGALAWLDTERSNLVSAVLETARGGPWSAAWVLADALRGYFWIRRFTVDWLAVARAGQAAAQAAGDARAGAAAELSLAMAYRCLNDYSRAAEHYEQAKTLSGRANWPLGQAAAMNNVSCVYVRLGQLQRAEERLRSALDLNKRDKRGRTAAASNLGNLGYVYLRLGRLREAETHFTESLALRRVLDDRYGQADALQGLGECYHGLGRFDDALDRLAEAFTLFQEIGSLDGEALIRCVCSEIHCDLGRYPEAIDHAERAIGLVDRTTDRYSEALARNRLGAVRLAVGDDSDAIDQHSRALRLARETDGPYPQAEALVGLAAALRHGASTTRHAGTPIRPSPSPAGSAYASSRATP
ncbi:MAG TPA: BTAD domain-containing putative transcriptional regulator, partial [Pilimelia sp.]|nr:BTAD domain-containing putative transcriptional regulator [Pilimelia sp.]